MGERLAAQPQTATFGAGSEEAAAAALARGAAAVVISIGIGVLAGWTFDLALLKSGLPELRATRPISAIVLLACGIALAGAASKSSIAWRATQLFASLVLAVALYSLARLIGSQFGAQIVPWDGEIERWFFQEALADEGATGPRARMSDAAAVLFVIIASTLLLSRSRLARAQTAFVTLATVGLLLSASVLVSLVFRVPSPATPSPISELSVPLALGQAIAVIGTLCLRPDLGWMRLLAGKTPAAREMRSLAIGVIALPLVLVAVLQFGLHAGLYDAQLRAALMVLGSIIVVFIALLMSAARLKRIDDDRQRTLEARLRVESELSMALAAAKMVGFQCDLRSGTVRRFASGAPGRSFTEEHGTYESHLKTVHPEDRRRVHEYLQRQQREGRSDYQLQYRTQRSGGEVRWVLERGEIRYDDKRAPIEIAGVAVDITQTVQVREALKESEERFRKLAEAMPQIVFVCGPNGELEYINQRWIEYTGLRPEDHRQAIEADDFEHLQAVWQQGIDRGTQLTAEFRLRGKDGTYRWFLTRAEPIRDDSGRIVRWCGTSTDIDAQKRAHEELRLVADHADVLLAHCDAEERYVFVNRAYTTRFGLSTEEVIGKTLREVIGEAAYERVQPYVQRALAGEHVTFEVEIPYEQIGTYYMHCRYVPDIDPATNRVLGFVGGITDVTERRKLEDQLREADHRKDEFLALLAHELRNPLAPIRYAAGLLKPGVPQEISAAAHDVIERQVGHMARLLDDLLDVSRLTRNTLELRLERVDLRAIVTASVDTVRPLFEAVNHRLTVALPPEPAWVMGDSTRLLQVLGNLLNNAAKFTDPGGRIEVEVGREAGRFALRVRDSGIGIAPELQPKLFELFVQGDRKHTRGTGGLGVGLSLAKRLVEMHGGSIEAHSEGFGSGSVFTVRLPMAVEAVSSEPRAVAENVLPIFHRKHQLLIVDDNMDAANSLAIIAQMSGFVTHIANDGLAAIEMADLVRPEGIIMDLGMPKMSGYEAARWVRQQPWGKDTVLIAVTGWGQEEDRRRSRDAGFDVHLTKPVDSAELLNHLHQRRLDPGAGASYVE